MKLTKAQAERARAGVATMRDLLDDLETAVGNDNRDDAFGFASNVLYEANEVTQALRKTR